MIKSNDFPWNGNQVVEILYLENNYREIKYSENNTILIFFSGNGLYFPNTEECFSENIIINDRYEWENIAKHSLIKESFGKVIFVRDIYKQWYVSGINKEIDNFEKLITFLSEKCEGYDIVTCGNSAGGYAAVLAGILLKARKIYNFSGQYDLWIIKDPGPLVEMAKEREELYKYFIVRDYIKDYKGELYYFYPNGVEDDLAQNDTISDLNIKRFCFLSDKHGVTMKPICFPYVLSMDEDGLNNLCMEYKDHLIGEKQFFKRIVPWIDRILYYFNRLGSKLLKRH